MVFSLLRAVCKSVVASELDARTEVVLVLLQQLLPGFMHCTGVLLLLAACARTCSMALLRSRVSNMQMLLSVLQLANTLSSVGDHWMSSTLPLWPLYTGDTCSVNNSSSSRPTATPSASRLRRQQH